MTRRALLLIDVQNEYLQGLPIAHPPIKDSLEHIKEAVAAARSLEISVIAVQQMAPAAAPVFAAGSYGAELHSAIARSYDDLVVKHLPDAFVGTGLREALRNQNIDTLAVAGYMTHNCVLATVLTAAQSGFAVELLSDATGSLPYKNKAGEASAEELHRASLVIMQARYAAVMPTAEWISVVRDGAVPVRETIYESNQKARGL